MTALTSRMVRHQLRGAVRRLGGDVHTVINTWLFFDTYGVLGEQRRVFWWSDDPAAAAAFWGADADRLRAAEERLAGASDLVVAVNEEAARRWEQRGRPAAYVPNGCDPGPYRTTDEAPDPGDVALPGPIAGFVGHLNSRTDLALLEAVADAGTSLLLIGPKDPAFEPERFAALVARPNVLHLGPRPFETLPSYLRLIDVGLVPYGDTEFNRLSFPLKTLEYLAAGRPVVSTPLPAVRWLETELVTLAATPEAFAQSVAQAAARPRDAEIVGRRRAFAERHSWARRAEAFAGLLGLPA
jgi:glycosyltransferase involved in cell wall biosynthesis